MTDKVQKIREEIEIVVNRRLNLLNGDYFELDEESDGFTNEIMDIIDSQQKEVVSEDLEEAAFDYAESCKYDGGEKLLCVEHFKAGANWQKEQIMKKEL